jgi:hypothetical protein
MREVLKIMAVLGWKAGMAVKIENEPWMALCIEDIGALGPNGRPAISVAHYGEQAGDAMRDPEMCFEVAVVDGKTRLYPYTYRNDYLGVDQVSSWAEDAGAGSHTYSRLGMKRDHEAFARTWNQNLRAQGFLAAAKQFRAQQQEQLVAEGLAGAA